MSGVLDKIKMPLKFSKMISLVVEGILTGPMIAASTFRSKRLFGIPACSATSIAQNAMNKA